MAKPSKKTERSSTSSAMSAQGASNSDVAFSDRTDVTIDTGAKMDPHAAPSTAPQVVPARHQQGGSSLSTEGSFANGQAPSPEQIAHRAYELYLERGGEPGREHDDWYAAERELRSGARH